MKKNKTKKFIILLLFSYLNIWSQGKWEQGYVVTKNNDTITGLIKFKNKSKSPSEIKIDVKGIIKTYTPIELRSFTIKTATQDLFFKSVITQLSLADEKNLYINITPEPKYITDTIFVQLIVDGKKKLFFHYDDQVGSSHYLIEDNIGNMVDLVYLNYYINENKIDVASNNLYKTQLITFLTDCNEINDEKINKIGFNEKELMALFKDYNSCFENNKNFYVYKEDKIKCQFGVVAGFNRSALNFMPSDHNFVTKLQLNVSMGINFGLFTNIVFPRTGYRWSFYGEALFNQFKYTSIGDYDLYQRYGYHYIIKDAEIKASTLKLFTALRYQTIKYKINPFFQIGMVNSFAFKRSSKSMIETSVYYEQNKVELLTFRKYQQSLFMGIGAQYKKIGAEFRYEREGDMADEIYINSNANYLYFLIYYRF